MNFSTIEKGELLKTQNKFREANKMKKIYVIMLALILAVSLAACGGGGGGNSDGGGGNSGGGGGDGAPAGDATEDDPGSETAGNAAGIYVLFSEGPAQEDVSKAAGEGEEGFIINYFFSIYACQTDAKSPPGAGGYEGAARLSSESDFNDALSGMLEGIDLPAMVSLDMSSDAKARSLTFNLRKDDSDSDVELRDDFAPIFEGGKQFSVAGSADGVGMSQDASDEGACPLPMTIEVFGDPQDSVRPALITLDLCGDGTRLLKFEGALSLVPWSGNEKYVDSDEFKARIAGALGE